ncbi:hypothetical protein OIU84_024421 [Salix udensis]|uniref:Uncharacterized protein n=1 Tax=Salix udensis TaxID=889485 RepID=A0AAD6PAP5_9ROSI|nr:hypothetical protein OIU84_024421 [Salix udensis]
MLWNRSLQSGLELSTNLTSQISSSWSPTTGRRYVPLLSVSPSTVYSLADFGLELNAARVTVDLAFNIQVIYCIGRDEKGGEAKNRRQQW